MLESGPIEGYDVKIRGTNDYADTANSDLVVITAGFARKPGMSRDDLLKKNYEVVKGVTEKAAKYSPGAILIVVTNPLDAMVQTAFRVSGFPKNRVIGMAGVLDTARYRTFIAEALNVSVLDVHGFVLGGHGDTMVPVPRYTSVAGIPVEDLMAREQLEAIIKRTRNGGAEVVNLLKTGSAFYAPSSAVLEMVDSIFADRKKILPCTVYLEGEYGIHGVFVGVLVKLGAHGIEQIVQIKLTPEEQAALQRSAAAVRELVEIIGV
jgi:malate dehydrogenase